MQHLPVRFTGILSCERTCIAKPNLNLGLPVCVTATQHFPPAGSGGSAGGNQTKKRCSTKK
eukprot:215059-Pyramimonas_sp.AAC.1